MSTTKSPEMEAVLNGLAVKLFGRTRNDTECVTCGSTKVGKPSFFSDTISWEEWKISKMCQSCQNDIWDD